MVPARELSLLRPGDPQSIGRESTAGVDGHRSRLDRQELGIHIQALYAMPLGKRGRLMLAGGPSVFHLTQDLVRSIEFDTLPGFTALNFDQALIQNTTQTAT